MPDDDLIRFYREQLRTNFCAFFVRGFAELNPGTDLAMNPHIEVIADRLCRVRAGQVHRLIINLPPRHAKSLVASVAFPAWCLGHNPAAQILCVSYAQDLSDKHARDCRTIIESAWYQQVFPRTRLLSRATSELLTTVGGVRLATSVGGVLTGRGAGLIIVDDPLKPADAYSETQRQAVNDWFSHTLYSRLNDKRTGAIVVIMQRLHEDDLVGHVLEQEPWEVLRFTSIAEEDEEYDYMTSWGRRCFRRRKGEALHPTREPLSELAKIRRLLGEYNFAGQYQQAPAPRGGGLVKEAWFRRYRPQDKPEPFDRVIQSWDTANTVSELSDYSVCTTWGVKGNCIYLLDVLRQQLEYPDLKRAVRAQQRRYLASNVLIEERASGVQLIQDLRYEGMPAVTPYTPRGDKIMRMHSQTALIESGAVLLPTEAPWLAEYLREMTTFPNGRYDDQVDSTAQALDWFKMPMSNWGIYELYRQQALKLKYPERFRVRLRMPDGLSSGHVQIHSGLVVTVAPDRTIEVCEDDAKDLINQGWQKLDSWYDEDPARNKPK